MTWTYSQSTGVLRNAAGARVATGYSGHGPGLDNPQMQNAKGVGPLPQGSYTIGAPKDPPDHLGVLAMPLTPDAQNVMFGRSAFFIHGDNAAMNFTASDGCIILDHATRQAIHDSADHLLQVVA